MPPSHPCSVAAESMEPFTGPPDPSFWQNAGRWVDVTPGNAKITRGYRLPAKWIIHTVGPIWKGGTKREPELLASCYSNSLRVAIDHQVKTIAFPAISCGVYGYPIPAAASVAVGTLRTLLLEDATIDRVFLCCFTDEVWNAYRDALAASPLI